MKAVRFHDYGDSSVLTLEDVPVPEVGPGQVLVKVTAAGVNPADAAIRAGGMREFLPMELPHVPCIDVSGTVVGVGPGVSGWSEGTQVAAFLPINENGSAAEYVLAAADLLAAVPSGVDLVDAAALPAVALTAKQALFKFGRLAAGQRVLINGAGGGVGAYAVQLAHEAGAEVTATASPRSAGRVRAYGADTIIDHTVTPVVEVAKGAFNLIVNLVPTSPEETDALAALTGDNGVFVTATTPVSTEPGRGVTASQVSVQSDAGELSDLFDRVAAGTLQIYVSARRPLSELAAVHAELDRGEQNGKTVIVL